MGSEVVIFDDAAPVGIDEFGAELAGADAVFPVVFIGEAAAWPAEDGDIELAQGMDDILADTAGIGDGGVFPDPDAFIDTASEVFGEVAVDIGVDGGAGLVGLDGGGGCLGGGGSDQASEGEGAEGEQGCFHGDGVERGGVLVWGQAGGRFSRGRFDEALRPVFARG